MTETRRHHFVPQFLLSAFTDQRGMLFFARKNSSGPEVKCSHPRNLFIKRNLYSHRGKLTRVTTDIEALFSHMESEFAPIHRKILSAVREGKTIVLGLKERLIVIDFVIRQWKRTLDQSNRMKETARAIASRGMESTRRKLENEFGPLSPDDQYLLGPEARKEYVKLIQLDGMASSNSDVASQLLQYELRYLRIVRPRCSFIVGSSPVVLYNEMGRLIGPNEARDFFLELSSNVALKIAPFRTANRVVEIDDRIPIREWNEKIRDQSTMIAGESKQLIRSLCKKWT